MSSSSLSDLQMDHHRLRVHANSGSNVCCALCHSHDLLLISSAQAAHTSLSHGVVIFKVLGRPNQVFIIWTWVSLRADKMQSHLHERPRHPSESTEPLQGSRFSQHWPFISIFFTLLFSFFTQAHTRSAGHKRIIGTRCKKWQGWPDILSAITVYHHIFR